MAGMRPSAAHLRLLARRLPVRVADYDYKKRLNDDAPGFPNESKRLQKQGYLNLADLKDIAKWKSTRSANRVNGNSDSTVRQFTRIAFGLADNRNLPASVPIAILTNLKGVRVPTASVILTVWKPKRYGIIDVYVWWALFGTKHKGEFRPTDYDDYLSVVGRLQRSTGLTAREVDMALWKEGAEKARRQRSARK
jgi:hypothetical protein